MSSFEIQVDTADVDRMLADAEHPISNESLEVWLADFVSPFLANEIIDVFAGHGPKGTMGGRWPALSDATIQIRHAQGYFNDDAINERSGKLLNWLLNSRGIGVDANGAFISLPGTDGDAEVRRELEHAQQGYVQTGADLMPGAVTPPRPVLSDLTPQQMQEITAMFALYLAQSLSGSLGGSLVGA